MPVRNVNIDNRENPFNTFEGQEVVSINESFFSRLYRQGRYRSAYVEISASSNPGVVSQTSSIQASPGTMLYISSLALSCNIDAVLVAQVTSSVPSVVDGEQQFVVWSFAKAGTPITMSFNGDIVLKEYQALNVGIVPVAPYVTTTTQSGITGTTSGSTYTLSPVNTANLKIGYGVSGTGIASGATIQTMDPGAGSITINRAFSGTVSNETLTFSTFARLTAAVNGIEIEANY